MAHCAFFAVLMLMVPLFECAFDYLYSVLKDAYTISWAPSQRRSRFENNGTISLAQCFENTHIVWNQVCCANNQHRYTSNLGNHRTLLYANGNYLFGGSEWICFSLSSIFFSNETAFRSDKKPGELRLWHCTILRILYRATAHEQVNIIILLWIFWICSCLVRYMMRISLRCRSFSGIVYCCGILDLSECIYWFV